MWQREADREPTGFLAEPFIRVGTTVGVLTKAMARVLDIKRLLTTTPPPTTAHKTIVMVDRL